MGNMATASDYRESDYTNTLQGAQIGANSAPSQHKRTYQACIPCRKRKVRCDLGPVDNPHEPPCVRCRRESKDCYFSATRRKRKAEGGDDDLEDDSLANDDYTARNGRKRSVKLSGSVHGYGHQQSPDSLSATSPLDGYEGNYQQPGPYSTDTTSRRQEEDPDQEVTNDAAAALFQTPINIPGDALHLLLKASKENETLQRRDTESTGRRSESQSTLQPTSAPADYKSPPPRGVNDLRGQNYLSNIDPAIYGKSTRQGRASPRILSTDIIRLWSRLRFVRAGWFTAREAVEYIDYFYDYINPLTPISLPPFRNDTAHSELLQDEPMLTVTLLTIASRYMKLEGPGSATRSFMVHERLWTYLQNTITRMFWGQEQFGGGFCGAGAQRRGQMSSSRGSLRSLGTIESLLLLNEFHPRSMHFPPRDDEDDILTAVDEDVYNRPSDSDRPTNGDSNLAESWSEPALRSDRMCWSLIGTSLVLAYEVGIFGRYSDGISIQDARIKRQSLATAEWQRIDRIERLLYIFHLQCSGRFGLPIMYADQIDRFSLADMHQDFASVDARLPDPVDKTQQCWVDLMTIMKATNETLFSSKAQTAKLVQSGDYMRRLQTLQPLLRSWYERFIGIEVAKYPRVILSIEYHYINLYINALALQAVLEQWTTKTNANPAHESPASPASSISSSFSTYYGKNEPYIKEVIASSRTVLRHVVEDLLPNDFLKHAPVRTFFRIVSATMFLLKTFALGGKANEVQVSLHLLGATARALRTSYVDDVHLCLRIADLLDGLLASIKPRFIRLPPRPLTTPELARRSNTYMDDAQNNQPLDSSNQFKNYWSNISGLDSSQNPLAGLPRDYNNPRDSNISIIPPIGSNWAQQNPSSTTNYPFTNPNANIYGSGQQATAYGMPGNATEFPMTTEDDWLTLNVNPLLGGDGSGMTGNDGTWLSAFGPEMHDNLEVLGKLTGEQGYGNGNGNGNGGMGGY